MQTTSLPEAALMPSVAQLEEDTSFNKTARFFIEISGCLVVILLALEVLFAVAGVGEQEVLQIEKTQGYIPFTDKNVCWRKEGYSRCRFDNWGIPGTGRKVDIERDPEIKRIAMIGDSYVEALQVFPEKSACLLLEKKLNDQKSSTKTEVLNFGVQGHNLSQTYVRLKDFVINFKPDLVILPIRPFATYILPPNTAEGFLGARPNFYLNQSGKLTEDRTVQDIWLKSRSARRMTSTDWARKNSRLYGVFGKSMESVENWKLSGGLFRNFKTGINQIQTPSKPKNTCHNEAIAFWWPVADALLVAMDHECKKIGATLVVVRLPGVNGQGSELETNLLSKSVLKNQIRYIDSTSAFQAEINLGRKLFYDTHFNEEGNALLADQIFEVLKDSAN